MAMTVVTKKSRRDLIPTLPSFCGSWILVMPIVIEDKTRGTMIILINRKKIVPIGRNISALGPATNPVAIPRAIAIKIFVQSFINLSVLEEILLLKRCEGNCSDTMKSDGKKRNFYPGHPASAKNNIVIEKKSRITKR
jgi:hypothetical protein